MDFIDVHEPGRKLSFLVYPDDISTGIIERATVYTRQLGDIDPDAQIVFDNLPNSLLDYEKIAINNFVKNCKAHNNWAGIKEFVCYALNNEENARTGFKGIAGIGLMTGYGVGLSKVREGWQTRDSDTGGGVSGIRPPEKMDILFNGLPPNDVFMGFYLYSSLTKGVNTTYPIIFGTQGNDGYSAGVIDNGHIRAQFQSASWLDFSSNQMGSPWAQKKFLVSIRQEGDNYQHNYVNGVKTSNDLYAYVGDGWNSSYPFGLVAGGYKAGSLSEGYTPNETLSFSVWGQHGLVAQSTLYEDSVQLLRDLKIDV